MPENLRNVLMSGVRSARRIASAEDPASHRTPGAPRGARLPRWAVAVLTALICGAAAPGSDAQVVMVNFAGTIDEVNLDPFGLGLVTGQSASGSFQYDPTATPVGPGTDAFGGNGFPFPENFVVTIDGTDTIAVAGSSSSHIRILDDADLTVLNPSLTSVDRFALQTRDLAGNEGVSQPATVNGSGGYVTRVEFDLADTTGLVFATDAALPAAFKLADFDLQNTLQLSDTTGDPAEKTSFRLSFTSVTATPEPSTPAFLALAAAGILAWGGTRR